MADVRAKFYVRQVTAIAGQDGGSVEMQPVTRGGANAGFASATPSGQITMTITNPSAWRFFRDMLGKEFFVDFTEYTPKLGDGHKFEIAKVEKGVWGHGCCVHCGVAESEHE